MMQDDYAYNLLFRCTPIQTRLKLPPRLEYRERINIWATYVPGDRASEREREREKATEKEQERKRERERDRERERETERERESESEPERPPVFPYPEHRAETHMMRRVANSGSVDKRDSSIRFRIVTILDTIISAYGSSTSNGFCRGQSSLMVRHRTGLRPAHWNCRLVELAVCTVCQSKT